MTDLKIQTWKTVAIGLLGSTETAHQQLNDAGVRISDLAMELLARTTFETIETSIELVRISVRELGLEDRATTAEVYAAGHRLGLSLCPAEVALQLLLQKSDLPVDEWSLVAMEPIMDMCGAYSVFRPGYFTDGPALLVSLTDISLDNYYWVFARK